MKSTLLLLLGISAALGALLGCGAAPASQTAESVAVSAAPMAAPTEQATTSAPAANISQADSAPPKAAAAMDNEPAPAAVEVGYKIGMHAPEFGMSLVDGTKVTSESIVEAGKPAFIYFHATW